LDIFNRRLASKKEYFQLFLVCAFPVHVWAILTLMKWASTLTIPLSGTQIMSVVDYVLLFALLESLFVFGLLFIFEPDPAGSIFPLPACSARTVIIFIASISAAFIHFYKVWDIQPLNSIYGPACGSCLDWSPRSHSFFGSETYKRSKRQSARLARGWLYYPDLSGF
jgi:hypothetical protein